MDIETILKIADMLVPALAGLAGVLVGAWMTGRSQKAERRHAWKRRQLDEFYSPMLGLRARILAKSETRVKISGAANAAWRNLVERTPDQNLMKVIQERKPDFEAIVKEDNRALVEEILPLYRKMVDEFAANMGIAEPETRAYFGALVEFVEIWDRWLATTLPPDVASELGHSEKPLHPFYENLARNLERLQKELGR